MAASSYKVNIIALAVLWFFLFHNSYTYAMDPSSSSSGNTVKLSYLDLCENS